MNILYYTNGNVGEYKIGSFLIQYSDFPILGFVNSIHKYIYCNFFILYFYYY